MILTKDTPHADMAELMTIHMSEGEPTWEQVSRFHRGLLALNWGVIERTAYYSALVVKNYKGKPLYEIPTRAIQFVVESVLQAEVPPLFVSDGYAESDLDAHGMTERFHA